MLNRLVVRCVCTIVGLAYVGITFVGGVMMLACLAACAVVVVIGILTLGPLIVWGLRVTGEV